MVNISHDVLNWPGGEGKASSWRVPPQSLGSLRPPPPSPLELLEEDSQIQDFLGIQKGGLKWGRDPPLRLGEGKELGLFLPS